MKKEIKIVGAGLSGLTAAINLAKAGFKVKVFEKNEIVGKRYHGDYQGIENWIYEQDALEQIKSFNLHIDFPYYPANNWNIVGPDGGTYNYQLEKPFVYVVKRGTQSDTLDQFLYHQACQVGVEIIFNSSKNHLQFGDIIAQGFFPDNITDVIAIGYTFPTRKPNQFWGLLNDEIAPDGYAYCLIANGQATLAICIFRDYQRRQEYLEKAFKIFQEKIGFEGVDKKFFGGTSNIYWIKTATFNNRLYVGEAAGFIDGMWGFGMKYAIMTGYLAAQSIIQNQNYDSLLKKYVYPSFKASLVNRWFYKILNRKGYQLFLKKIAKNPGTFFKKLYNYSFIHQLGFPFAKFFLRKILKDRRKFS